MEARSDAVRRPVPIESSVPGFGGVAVLDTYRVGGRAIQVVRPTDPDRLLDDPAVIAWNRLDDYMPYWAYVWPGAFMLAEAVLREPWGVSSAVCDGLEALEIGCGVGLAGLAAMAVGLRVRFTDYDEMALAFVARSVAANGFDGSRSTFGKLDWRELPDQQFPIILGSDVIYETRLVPLVARLLGTLLAPEGLALIATPFRRSADGFPAAVAAAGLVARAVPAEARTGLGETARGTIFRVTWT